MLPVALALGSLASLAAVGGERPAAAVAAAHRAATSPTPRALPTPTGIASRRGRADASQYSIDARRASTTAQAPDEGEGTGGGSAPTPTPSCQPVPLPPQPVAPAPPLVVDQPRPGVPEREGPSGRLLLGVVWYFQLDEERTGEQRELPTASDLTGWRQVTVPYVWNGDDTTRNRAGWGWYRKEFRLPELPAGTPRPTLWRLRFLGVKERATVWLNGRLIGQHSGGYTPFELDAQGLRALGVNRLVVRASTMRGPYDLSHWRFEPRACRYGRGGWWNFGGIDREVEIRPVYGVDIERAQALPRLRCPRCPARLELRALLRNASRKPLAVTLRARVRAPGGRRTIDQVIVRRRLAAGERTWVEGAVALGRAILWEPARPALYDVSLTALGAPVATTAPGSAQRRRAAQATGVTAQANYRLNVGVRLLETRPGGILLLNGRPLSALGVSFHEDDPRLGSALGARERAGLVRRLRDLGATMTRSHYPPHPALLEAFDRAGILYWAQPPVYQLSNGALNEDWVRRDALEAVRQMVEAQINHPSVVVWSLGNELALGDGRYAGGVGAGYERYVEAGVELVRSLDPTRLVGIDRAAPEDPTRVWHPVFDLLDVLGVNEYFGWYRGRDSDAGAILDQFHKAYPDRPIVVTEFGAESTHEGPPDRKGTYAFQTRYLLDHLAQFERRRWIAGSLVWILRDFRVNPDWTGGNPNQPTPPWNNKGLIDESGAPKPAYWELRKLFRARRGAARG